MAKLFLLLSLLDAVANTSHAQSITDLLVELQLDKEKLTSMKNTLQEMYQGYETLEQGYTHVRDIAKANFNLHAAFLDALLDISPGVRNDPRIVVILNTQSQIVSGYGSSSSRWRASGVFTASEMTYIVDTYAAIFRSCLQSVEELNMILTADELRMSDAERLQAIGRINADTHAQLGRMQELDNALSLQTIVRLRATGDLNTIKALYDLPN